ncbi:YciI family protein [Pelagibius marinus]|uniref:YciI family protein n=1 Tax=Pelagibius marinus TaxID=2762760 RepID=UPI0029CA4596|nr:YciI family protein [Pelagibius marinus]
MSEVRSLYVVDLTYIVPLSEVDQHVPAHIDFLDKSYASGLFLASGAKVPRTGGVIIAMSPTKSELEDHLAEDPFQQNGVAKYEITEFKASKHQPHLFG